MDGQFDIVHDAESSQIANVGCLFELLLALCDHVIAQLFTVVLLNKLHLL